MIAVVEVSIGLFLVFTKIYTGLTTISATQEVCSGHNVAYNEDHRPMKAFRRLPLPMLLIVSTAISLAEEYTINVDLTFDTKYVFRGTQLADDVFHPSVEFAQGDFYAGIWAAQPIENRGVPEEWTDEVDFYVGQGWALGEKTSLDIGAAHYYFPKGEGSTEPFIGLTREIRSVAASVYLYRDVDLGVTTSESSARYSLPLSGKTSLDLGAHFGLIDGDDFGKYLYYGADVLVPIQLKENAIFSFGVHYDDSDEGSPTPDSLFHGSTSITIGF